MKVEIQSKKLVKPATPTPSHLQNLNLSSIDQLMYPLFIPVIFYFDRNSNGSDHQMMQTTEALIARLEESLSKVLSLYYPFAGRYNEDDSCSTICCDDQGAELVVASVDGRLDEIVYGEYHHLLISDVHASPFTSATPLLSVQVNVFTCGGLAIGVGLMHKLGDMFTFSMFLQAWATSCRLNGISDQLPLPNLSALSSVLPPKSTKPPSSPSLPASTQLLHPPPNYIMKRFTFSGEAISKLKSQLNPSDYTRVEIVTALLTRCLINIECSKPDIMATFLVSHPMNMRSRTTLPIQENSSGNFCTMVVATRQVENESRDLQELASLIRNSLRNAADEIGKVGNWDEIGGKVEGAILEFNQRQINREKVNPVIFTSWCKFGLNEIDFGLGKPSLVSTVKEPLNIIRLVDCKKDARGIEAWVCLKEDDMTCFREEPDILKYASF